MNKRILIHPVVCFCFFLSMSIMLGCGVKTKFSQTDLKWMNVYNEGDVLIFKSGKGELDTSIIVKKEIFYPEYNPGEEHGKYLPQWGVVWYKNRNLKYHPDGDRLITIEKKKPNETYLSIDYLYRSFIVLNLNSGGIEKFKDGKVYAFDTYHEKATGSQPKKVFWHEDYGIIKYITHDNVTWERINLPK